jgi:hypothetical protein
MNAEVIALFEEDGEVPERARKVWEAIFSASNKVIVQAEKYGFHGIDLIPNPNIHVILGQLRILSAVMGSILLNGSLEYEETRLILNAQEQLKRMELVALALKAGNRTDYDKAISDLERQAAI